MSAVLRMRANADKVHFQEMKHAPVLLLLLLSGCAVAAPDTRREFAAAVAKVPDAERGEQLFARCIACHGADGAGVVSGSIPRIAGQHYRVLVRQIVDFRHGRRWDVRMEGAARNHEVIASVQDIADVAWYVSQLERDGIRGVGDGQYVGLGARLYEDKCASCHGRNGEGDGPRGIATISGQHASYLSRQIYDAVDGRRPPLSRSHRALFKPLSFEEVLGLTDYLSRVGWRPTSSIMRTSSATD